MNKRKAKQVLPIITPCNDCVGFHAIDGCPSPNPTDVRDLLDGESLYYWPPEPDDDSWCSDICNEGILFDGESVVSCKADYHGFFLMDPDGNWHWPSNEGRPVPYYDDPDEVYAVAYVALKSLPELTAESFKQCLESLGWRPVKCTDEEPGPLYWGWADGKGW